MSKMIDMIGKTIGDFTVIERTGRKDKKRRAFWRCKCNICKREFEIRGDNLRLSGERKCVICNGGGGKYREIV